MHTKNVSFIGPCGSVVPVNEAERLGYSIHPHAIWFKDTDEESGDQFTRQFNRINGSFPQSKDAWESLLTTF